MEIRTLPGLIACCCFIAVEAQAILLTSFDFVTVDADNTAPKAAQFGGADFFIRERANLAQTTVRVRAFVLFDVTPIAGQTVTSAIFNLHEFNKLNNVNSEDMDISRVTVDWDPNGAGPGFPTFNQPIADTMIFGNNGPASAGPAVDIDFAIDITSYVQQWASDPAQNFGLRLAFANPAFVGAGFSDSGADAPTIDVTLAPAVGGVPEPSSLALGLAVLGGVSYVRRRRTGKK